MDNFLKPHLQSPNFNHGIRPPYYMTPHGLLLPQAQQPPPMYGPRGSTVAPKFLNRPYKQPAYNFKQNKQNFCCETCDRGFGSKEELDSHVNEHQKCGIDGCQFVGHPLVVTKHIQMQHSSGLFEKFKNLDTPEDIEKWRAERKKKFPTQKNVEQRQKAQEERSKRGERINEPNNRFGRRDRGNNKNKFNDKPNYNRDRNNFKSKQFNRNNNNRNLQNESNTEETGKNIIPDVKVPVSNPSDDDDESPNHGYTKFKGTSMLKDYKRPEKENPLKNLIGMYGSDSDDESVNEEVKETPKEIINIIDTVKASACVDSFTEEKPQEDKKEIDDKLTTQKLTEEGELCSDNDDMPESVPIVRKEETKEESKEEKPENLTPHCSNKEKRNKRRQRKRKGNTDTSEPNAKAQCPRVTPKEPTTLINYKNLRKSNQNTLLEKLLQEQIRRERNIILQCVRYVVSNNFFMPPTE